MKEILKIASIAQGLLSALLLAGVIACGVFKNTPHMVEIASMLALIGWFGEKGFSYYQRAALSRLSSVESTELSFLRQIRATLARGEKVSDEQLSVSGLAINDSDSAYEKVYGFGRPLPASGRTILGRNNP